MFYARCDGDPLTFGGEVLLEVAQLAEPYPCPPWGRRDQHHRLAAALYRAVGVRLARARQVRTLRVHVRAQDLFELLDNVRELAATQTYERLAGADIWRHNVHEIVVRLRVRHRREGCDVGNALHAAVSGKIQYVSPVRARLLVTMR